MRDPSCEIARRPGRVPCVLLDACSAKMIGSMKIGNAIASIAVKDLKAASAWYEKLFGRPADSTPMAEVAEWKFERGRWLQVYQLPERSGAGSCTLAVSDIAGVIAHLESLGIDTSETTSGVKVKTVMVSDPDGNHLAFAQAFDPTMAR
jgi:predicted enzyme related to lactoylglutathione lyase